MSKTVSIVLIIIVIAASVGFALYFSTTKRSSNATAPNQLITSLALAHFSAIGEMNLSLLMSQYSTGYEAVWFFISNSSVGPTNGRYDCNTPRGPHNCSYSPINAWQTLFNNTKGWSYTICNLTVVPALHGREIVLANLWYLTSQNDTLRVPYEMDFQYYNNTWAVWKDWFGLQQNSAILLRGDLIPASCQEFSNETA